MKMKKFFSTYIIREQQLIDQWHRDVELAYQNRNPLAMKVLHGKAIVQGFQHEEEHVRELMMDMYREQQRIGLTTYPKFLRREQLYRDGELAYQNGNPLAVKVLHGKAIVQGFEHEEEPDMYRNIAMKPPQIANIINYRFLLTGLSKIRDCESIGFTMYPKFFRRDQWDRDVELAYQNGNPLAVEVLHGKAFIQGFEHEEGTLRKLMDMYRNIAMKPQIANSIYYRFLPTPLSKDQLVSIMHWLFDHKSDSSEILHFTRMPTIIHAKIISLGFHGSDGVVSRLMNLYSNMGSKDYVLLFDSLENKGPLAWISLLHAHADNDPSEAAAAFYQMLEKTSELDVGEDIHKHTARMFRVVLTAYDRYDSDPRDIRNLLLKMKNNIRKVEIDITYIERLIDRTIERYGVEEAIETLDELMCGLSDHICGMVFGNCWGRETGRSVDVEMALKMIDVVIRDGRHYTLDDDVYDGLVTAGVTFPTSLTSKSKLNLVDCFWPAAWKSQSKG